MANELRYVVVKKEDGKYSGFSGIKADLERAEPGRYLITLKKYRKSRSNKQNAYYHGVVIHYVMDALIDGLGFERRDLSAEIVHDMLKEKFLKKDIGAESTGEALTIIRSTTDLTTTEMMDYLDDINRWALEFLNIVIPLPGEQSELNY